MAPDVDDQDPPSLEEFSRRLDQARQAGTTENVEATARGKAMGQGFRLASELIAAIIVGLILGLGADALLGISPWGLLAGLFLGFGAGVNNVSRAMKPETEQDQEPDKMPDDKNE